MSKLKLSQDWRRISTHLVRLICILQLHKNNSKELNKHTTFLDFLIKMLLLSITSLNTKENFLSHWYSLQYSMKRTILNTSSKFRFILNPSEKNQPHFKRFLKQKLNKNLTKNFHLAFNTLSIFIQVKLIIQLKSLPNLKIINWHLKLKEVINIIKKTHHNYHNYRRNQWIQNQVQS